MQIHCESQITEVTVYARGALVRRRLKVPAELPPGEVELLTGGVTPLLEPGSLRAQLRGAGRGVVSVRSALRVPPPAPLVGPSVAEVRALVSRIERLQAEVARLVARRKRLLEQGLDPLLKPQSLHERLEARVEDSLSCLGGLNGICAELDARLGRLGEELRELEEKREAAALRDAQAATAARQGAGHPRREIAVRLAAGPVAGGADAWDLEVSYVVREARFWPVYTLRLSEGGRRAELLLEALIAQLSGEDWRGVRLSVSTADLLFDARLPELPSLRFGRAQAPPRRAYRPPPEGLDRMFTGHDRVFGRGPGQAAIAGAIADAIDRERRAAPKPLPPPPEELLELPDFAVPEAVDDETTGRSEPQAEMARAPRDVAVAKRRAATTGAYPAPSAPPQGFRAQAMAPPRPSSTMAPGAPPAAPMPAMAMPAAPRARGGLVSGAMSALSDVAEGFGGGGAIGGYGGPPEPEPMLEAPPQLEPDGAWLDFDALRLGGPSDSARGRLRPETEGAQARARQQAALQLEAITPPLAGASDPRASRGRFDHRYDAQGRCDVPAGGVCHRVALGAAAAPATLRFRSVPREAPEVYREVELQNPLGAPLLGGPVDVYVEGSLLLQTTLGPIDRGGTFTVGMGVEERLRIARNARSEEESAGLMGGSTVVTHTVSIEISSALGRAVEVEVLDRVPVTDDKSVEIKRVYARPEGEPYKQAERGQPVRGGWLWRVQVTPAAGQAGLQAQGLKKAQVEFQYRVTLPAKSEIVGGNRRE